MAEEKSGGFGSLPGDLFNEVITYLENPIGLTPALEPLRIDILVYLARAEHAAANAQKDPYIVDIAFKCLAIQTDFLVAKDAILPDPVRAQAMTNIVATLKTLKTLWVT